MTKYRILAAIDSSAAARPVLATAAALAPVLGADVEAVHVTEGGGATASALAERFGVPLRMVAGDPLEAITDLAAADDVVGVVVGSRDQPRGRRRVGHLARSLADRMSKPVVMVPPGAEPPDRVRTVLIAMEGTPAKVRNLQRAVTLAENAGVELVVLHVDDEDSIPSFSDQVQHETEAYAREFLDRYCQGAASARLETRIGVPADEIIAAVAQLSPALVALGWPQSDDPQRGAVAREVVDRSEVPVLLIAVA
jgi:nucleotide-binding universal stress UspA family protein